MSQTKKIIYIFPGVGRMSSRLGIINSEAERYNRVFREQHIVMHTRKLGYECKLFLPTCLKEERYTKDEVGAWFFPVDNPEDGNKKITSKALLKRIELEKPDLVVFKGADLGLSRWLVINSKHRFPYAIIIGGTPIDFLLSRSDYILAESDAQACYYFPKHYHRGKVSVLPKLLLPSDFHYNKKKDYDVVNVGQFNIRKNQKALIPFFKDFRVSLIGDGEFYNGIKKEADKYSENVYMPGYVMRNRVPYEISRAKLMIHTSKGINLYRGSPARVTLESFACGVPVVIVKKKGIIAVIEHGVNGLIVEENNLVEEVKKLLGNEELLKRMGQNALEYAKKYCTEEEVYKSIEKMYDSIFQSNDKLNNISKKVTPFIIKIKSKKQSAKELIKKNGKKIGLKKFVNQRSL